MANAEEIRRVVKVIEKEPARWRQAVWIDSSTVPANGNFAGWYGDKPILVDEQLYSCNTRACIAGHAVMLAGFRIDTDDYAYDAEGNHLGYVPEVAAQILGLTENQADAIFHPDVAQHYDESIDDYCGNVAELKQIITEVTGVTFDD